MIDPDVSLSTPEEHGSPRRRALAFAGTISGVLALAGAFKLYRGVPRTGLGLLGFAAFFLVYASVHPRGALVLRSAWLRLGGLLGKINSAIILSVIYVAVLTPIGAFMRAIGKRSFRLSRADAYLTPRKARDTKHFEHPY